MTSPTSNKYLRTIHSATTLVDHVEGVAVADVYEVLEAFNVTCPARQHAIKKLLCAGIRGKGNAQQDLREAQSAVFRAIEIEDRRVALAKATELVDDLRRASAPALDPDLVVAASEKLTTASVSAPVREGAHEVRVGQRTRASTGGQSRGRSR